MAEPRCLPEARAPKLSRPIGILLALLLTYAAVQATRLALVKEYTVDEFQYAHAAWATARGDVPYRDFFEVHFPFVYQLGAIVFWFLDDAPGNIVLLRGMMLLMVAITAVSLACINFRACSWWAILTPSILMSIEVFAVRGTEIRPDPTAFAFFGASLAVLCASRISDRWRGFLAGILLAVSLWSSQKVFYYGSVFAIAFLLDLTVNRARRRLLGSPAAFLAGAGTVIMLVSLYLSVTDSWSHFIRWCFQWAYEHQTYYPSFPWLDAFADMFTCLRWLSPFAVVGILTTAGNLKRKGRRAWGDPDLLLCLSVGTTLMLVLLQRAPFNYNLIPFAGVLSIFSARGLVTCIQQMAALPAPRSRFPSLVAPAAATALVLVTFVALRNLDARVERSNEYQHTVFDALNVLTSPEDPVYDNCGSYVTRPSVNYFFYTDFLLRRQMGDGMSAQVEEDIRNTGCTALLVDGRFWDLPRPLRLFLATHFQPYNRDLWLWGQRFEADSDSDSDSPVHDGQFEAIRDGEFFVWPPHTIVRGQLKIDGERVTAPVFRLSKGTKSVEYQGPREGFYLLWLPRNKEMYEPQPRAQPRFAQTFF